MQWPGYAPQQRITRITPDFELSDLALDVCEAIDQLMADVAKVREFTLFLIPISALNISPYDRTVTDVPRLDYGRSVNRGFKGTGSGFFHLAA